MFELRRHSRTRSSRRDKRPSVAVLWTLGLSGLLLGCVSPEERQAAADTARRERFQLLVDGLYSGPSASTNAPAGTPTAYAPAGKLAQEEVFIQPAETVRVTASDADRRGTISLNFAETDVREVAKVVLGDALGLNYVIDDGLSATVTIRSSAPLARVDVLPTLEAALAQSNIAIVRSSGVYRLTAMDKIGAFSGSGTNVRPGEAGFGTYVFALRHANAAQTRETLQPFVSAGRFLAANPGRSLLLFSGPATEARHLSELIASLDQSALSGKSFALMPLQRAAPEQLVQELKQIFSAGEQQGMLDGVKLIPVNRMNALLIIATGSASLAEIQTWVDRLDRGDNGPDRRLFVYRVQNGRAVELAQTLSLALNRSAQGGNVQRPAPGLRAARLEGERSNGASSRTVNAANVRGATGLTSTSSSEGTRNSGAGADGSTELDAGRTEQANFSSEIETEAGTTIRVVGEASSNSVLIHARPEDYRMVEATLRMLDRPPTQVMIEATIAEVTLNDDLKYGLQWFFTAGNERIRVSGTNDEDYRPETSGFDQVFRGFNARVALNALSRLTHVEVISSPQLLVRNNESAKLQVGEQVPIATASAQSVASDGAPLINSIDYKDTGVILSVVPRVNSNGLVHLDIAQEVSEVVPTTSSGLNSPTIQKRLIQSSVVVQSGEPIALGGLIRAREAGRKTGTPVASDIPLLGNLFKTTGVERQRTELIVLITPRIVRHQSDARILTEELRQRLPSFAPPPRYKH